VFALHLLGSLCEGAGRGRPALRVSGSALEPGLADLRNILMNGFRVSDTVLL